MELKSITFQHRDFELDFDGGCINKDYVKVSYDRTGNILIGMDVLSQMDIHIGKSKVLGKTVFPVCSYTISCQFHVFIRSVAEKERPLRMVDEAENTLRRILANEKLRSFKASYCCEKCAPDLMLRCTMS